MYHFNVGITYINQFGKVKSAESAYQSGLVCHTMEIADIVAIAKSAIGMPQCVKLETECVVEFFDEFSGCDIIKVPFEFWTPAAWERGCLVVEYDKEAWDKVTTNKQRAAEATFVKYRRTLDK
jgi:hypothetical protein